MKARIADTLRSLGYDGNVEDFRAALAEIKAERYPDMTDEELIYTRDEAGTYCQLVRKRLGAPRLTRPFILRALIGLRKNGGANRHRVASLPDGQAAR
jgi:hypothetical protein